jgi:hypothetical protein
MADPAQQVWVGRVDPTAQKDYEHPSNPQNIGKVELRRSLAAGMLNVNYTVSGDAALGTDYWLWGPVSTGYYNQVTDTKLGASGKVTFADGQDRLWVRFVPTATGGPAVEVADLTVTAGAGYAVADPHEGGVGVYSDRSPGFATQPNPNGGYGGDLLDVWVTTGQEMTYKGYGPYTGDPSATEAGQDPGSILVTYQYQSDDPGFVPPDPPAQAWVVGGTAEDGEDYTMTVTRVVTARTDEAIYFPSTGKTVYRISSVDRIDITPIDDTEWEGDETVDVAVGRSWDDTGGVIGDAQVTIADDAVASLPVVSVGAPDGVSTEWGPSTGAYRVTRDDAKLAFPLTVSYDFGGTATYGKDYTVTGKDATTGQEVTLPQAGTVTFPAGVQAIEIRLTPADETLDEGLEEAVLTLGAGSGYTLVTGTDEAALAIRDDDGVLSGNLEVQNLSGGWRDNGWVSVNNDNDNYNFEGEQKTSLTHRLDLAETTQVVGEDDLVKLRIYPVLGAAAQDKVRLKFSSPKIKIWKGPEADKRDGPVVSGTVAGATEFPATVQTDVYVEGLELSAARNDAVITLEWVSGANPNSRQDLDVARFTVYEVTGPMNVPGYSRHVYTTKLPGTAGATYTMLTAGATFLPDLVSTTKNGLTSTSQSAFWNVAGAVVGKYQVNVPDGFGVVRQDNIVKVEINTTDSNTFRLDASGMRQTPSGLGVQTSQDPDRSPAMYGSLRNPNFTSSPLGRAGTSRP